MLRVHRDHQRIRDGLALARLRASKARIVVHIKLGIRKARRDKCPRRFQTRFPFVRIQAQFLLARKRFV